MRIVVIEEPKLRAALQNGYMAALEADFADDPLWGSLEASSIHWPSRRAPANPGRPCAAS